LPLVLSVLLSGCGRQPEPLLRLGSNVWTGYETLYLARSLGLLREDRVRLVELLSSTDVMHALRNGNLEAGALTLDEALTLMAEGLALRVVLVMDICDGADALVAKPDIPDLAALRGRRVGVERSTAGALMLEGALEAAGLGPNDIQVVDLVAGQHLDAFRAGEVDAVVTFEPMTTLLLQRDARVLFDSSRMPGRILDVLVVREEVMERHRAGLNLLVRAQFQALALLGDEPAEAARRMAPRTGLTPDQLLATYGGLVLPDLEENRRLLTGTPPPLQAAATRLAGLMHNGGLLARAVDCGNLVDPGFLPEAPP